MIEPLIDDGRLRKLTFTGSTGVGTALAKQGSDKLLRLSMELGGNAPFIVFDDADVDAAVDGRDPGQDAQRRRGVHGGQPVPRRQLRPRGVHREAGQADERVHAGQRSRRIVDAGPADQCQAGRRGTGSGVRRGVARRHGAVGGVCARGAGHFYPATVLAGVPADARILKEEVFGPVAPLTGFDTEAEAIAAANDTEYGLASYIYTQSTWTAPCGWPRRSSPAWSASTGASSPIPAAPFGGIKESGFGREGGIEGIEEYLDTKYIALTS